MSKPCHFYFQNRIKHNFSLLINQMLISTIFSQLYCLHTNCICILIQLLVEQSNYSNKRYIQRCGGYQRGGAYQREALISLLIAKSVALFRGRHLFEDRRLLEEIRYIMNIYLKLCHKISKFIRKRYQNFLRTMGWF